MWRNVVVVFNVFFVPYSYAVLHVNIHQSSYLAHLDDYTTYETS